LAPGLRPDPLEELKRSPNPSAEAGEEMRVKEGREKETVKKEGRKERKERERMRGKAAHPQKFKSRRL